MGKRLDAGKRLAWEERMARQREYGGTVEQFCRREGVTVAAFRYWFRRLKVADATPGNAALRSAPGGTPATNAALTDDERGRIRVRLGADVEFLIPVDSLAALRCVVNCVCDSGRRGDSTFQQVVVAAR